MQNALDTLKSTRSKHFTCNFDQFLLYFISRCFGLQEHNQNVSKWLLQGLNTQEWEEGMASIKSFQTTSLISFSPRTTSFSSNLWDSVYKHIVID